MSLIKMIDGSTEMIFDRLDLLNAMKTHMGYEAMRLLEDYLDRYEERISELEKENEDLKKEVEELKEDV